MESLNNITKQQSPPTQNEVKTVDSQPVDIKPIQNKVKIQDKLNIHNAEVKNTDTKPIKTEPEIRNLIDSLNKALDPFNTSIRFGFDNSTEVFFVSVIDSYTKDIIRRFPVAEAETLAAKINDVVGLIFDEEG
ncbi:MAG TPA: flagellar protein FlaG [Sulfurimonas sp.]|nr:flagellar protein FlaG [Sulfurimonas sp.]